MRYVRPEYYDSFRCTADQCPDTCCAGWQITIDEESLERYARVEGDIGKRLMNGIDWREECFLQKQGKCVLLNKNGLCDLVLKAGEDALCQTCKNYPRHVEEFLGLREYSLSLSCPEAARIIGSMDATRLICREDGETDPLEEEFEAFDGELFEYLQMARETFLLILGREDWTMEEKKRRLLGAAEKLQECVDAEELDRMPEIIMQESALCKAETGGLVAAENEWRQAGSAEMIRRYQRRKEAIAFLHELEPQRADWEELLERTEHALYTAGAAHYEEICRNFPAKSISQNLLGYFLILYFYGAVYDGWIYSKVALAVYATEVIEELAMAQFAICGDTTYDHWIQSSYRLARELEHSDENLNMVEECYRSHTNVNL